MPACPANVATTARSIVLFDGDCAFCARTVRFIQRRDRHPHFRFVALQSPEGRELLARHGLPADRIDSVVLIEGGTVSVRSTAALRICRRLSGAWPLLYGLIAVPRRVRDAAYDFIAQRRGGLVR